MSATSHFSICVGRWWSNPYEYWEENVPACLPSLKFYVCEDVVSNSGGGKLGFSRDWGLLPFIHSSQNTNISTMKLYPLLVLQRERSQISYSQIEMWNIFINKYLKVCFVCFWLKYFSAKPLRRFESCNSKTFWLDVKLLTFFWNSEKGEVFYGQYPIFFFGFPSFKWFGNSSILKSCFCRFQEKQWPFPISDQYPQRTPVMNWVWQVLDQVRWWFMAEIFLKSLNKRMKRDLRLFGLALKYGSACNEIGSRKWIQVLQSQHCHILLR